MESMRDIKRRINSVRNTQKITNAMKMVAAARLRRAQELAEKARPFFNKTREILYNVSLYTKDFIEHPLFYDSGGKRHLYLVINSDRGLCGSYNINVIEKARSSFQPDEEISLIVLGRNARDYFRKMDYNIISEYINIPDYPDYWFARRIADELISLFRERMVDRVSLIYTHFNSPISQTAKVIPLLPLTVLDKPEEEEKKNYDYLYEPSPDAVFDVLLPSYINNILYSALLEAKASEFGAVMTAMDSATENAEDLIGELTLRYNRARQSAITTEIAEIVGGAEALK
ncbi:MAG: ATP synthase F1 subunit gamma [Halanaerobiaceae bacterium]|nr:ATP synthase F1 subunit gamma [Halanaerobiaceae bacterium]